MLCLVVFLVVVCWGAQARRSCNSTIGSIFPQDDIKFLLETVSNGIEAGASVKTIASVVLGQMVKNDIMAMKICGSCSSIMGSSYCGSGRFGADRVVSGLLLLPVENGELLPGMFKGSISMHPTVALDAEAPSELWPDDFVGLLGTDTDDPVVFFWENYRHLLAGIGSASAGTVTILPDYLGFGEDAENSKSHSVANSYRVATIPLWFQVRDYLESVTSGCTKLLDKVTLGGYGEGAYAAVAVSSAMNDLGVQILSVQAGAGFYRLSSMNLVKTFERMLDDSIPFDGIWMFASFASSYSTSENADLANANSPEQALLADEFLAIDLPAMVNNNSTAADILRSVLSVTDDGTDNDLTKLYRSGLSMMLRSALEQNSRVPCVDLYPTDSVDLLCDALMENDVVDILETVDYPVVFCHSANDLIVTSGNLPTNLLDNPNLQLFDALTDLFPAGGHFESMPNCMVASMIPFTLLEPGGEPSSVIQFDCSTTEPTPAPTVSPTLAPPTNPTSDPTPFPTTPSGDRGGIVTLEPTNPKSSSFSLLKGFSSFVPAFGAMLLSTLFFL